jgi:hypothetical protein
VGPPATADLSTLIGGFEQAYDRWSEARIRTDPTTAFYALFEALAWTYAIDELLRNTGWPRPPDLRGLRFARNRVHHQFSLALRLDASGGQFPLQFPITFFEWRWRDTSDLPAGRRDREGEAMYEQHLAGQPARLTLSAIHRYFATLT